MPRDDTGNDRERSAEKIPNSERLVQLGQAVDRRSSAPHASVRSRRRKWVQRTVIALGSSSFSLLARWSGITTTSVTDSSQNVTGLQNPGATENILMIGSTTRCGLKVQNIAYGLCSQGVTGVNSDIDMILHLDPSTGTVSLLSIPRDLFVPNARIEGANKIDAALYQGPSQLVAAIEEDFAIPINHYV